MADRSNFLFLHGAASTGWLWHRVEAVLNGYGHSTVAPDLPSADPTADLFTYVDVACAAAERFGPEPVVVVAQSMAGLIAPAIAMRRPTKLIVLLSAMIPRPGETGLDWWEATGQGPAQRTYLEDLDLADCDPMDPDIIFLHDVDDQLKAESGHHVSDQHLGPMTIPNPISGWPDVPTRVIAGETDRLFPLAFMRQLARDRVGVEVDTVPGGHLAALSHPDAVAELLISYLDQS